MVRQHGFHRFLHLCILVPFQTATNLELDVVCLGLETGRTRTRTAALQSDAPPSTVPPSPLH
jgi:hypothetical protein